MVQACRDRPPGRSVRYIVLLQRALGRIRNSLNFPTSLRGSQDPWQSALRYCLQKRNAAGGIRIATGINALAMTCGEYIRVRFHMGVQRIRNAFCADRPGGRSLQARTTFVRNRRGEQEVNCPQGKRSHPGVSLVRRQDVCFHIGFGRIRNGLNFLRHCEGRKTRGNPRSGTAFENATRLGEYGLPRA